MTTIVRPRGPSIDLPGPYAVTAGDIVHATPAVHDLVTTQVRALLHSSPSYYALDESTRARLEGDLTKIASYSAALLHEGFTQARRLNQTPVYRRRAAAVPTHAAGARAFAGPASRTPPPPPPEQYSSRAVDSIARVTKDTLNAVAFPTFVSDLIHGTFSALVSASIQQMEAFGRLLADVAKTVDQFMADNITDNQARDYLAQSYPGHFKVDVGADSAKVSVRDGADDRAAPDLKTDLGLTEDVTLDDDTAEQVLVPAARRKMAANRHQLLSTMVLMGINRIVVTSGRVRAKLDFHINAADQGSAKTATDFDEHNETSVHAGLIGWGGTSHNSLTFVSSTAKAAEDSIAASVDLSGEVDLKFKSDYFPLERFADTSAVQKLQANTPNPAGNPPTGPLTQPHA